jgi:hypothetical protein
MLALIFHSSFFNSSCSVVRELPDRVLNFMRSHPLMDGDVNHEGGAPVFYKRDVVFTHLAVDRLATGQATQNRVIKIFFYLKLV